MTTPTSMLILAELKTSSRSLPKSINSVIFLPVQLLLLLLTSSSNQYDDGGTGETRRKLTRAEKEQKRAERLERELFLLRSINTNLIEMRFEKKYVGKYLMQEEGSGEVRIVMNIKYCLERQCWYAETIEAEVDDRKYNPVEDADNSNVFIGRGSDKLGKFIKRYNQWADLSK